MSTPLVTPAKPATVTPSQPTVEDRIAAVEKRVTDAENNHQTLLKKLRKSIAFFDRK